jgi:hypothetical protein
MPTQVFDDGSFLNTDRNQDGDYIFSSGNATDSLPLPTGQGSPGLGEMISGAATAVGKTIGSIFDPSNARLAAAALLPGGSSTTYNRGVQQLTTRISTQSTSAPASDWRVSIKLADPSLFNITNGGSGIQSPLAEFGGVIFPYVPQISLVHNARFSEQATPHSNYKNYFYEGSDVQAITIQGDFTVQTISEGQYLLAAIYFFRSATKMWFGGTANSGNPPPLVKLNGYGKHYFPDVSCLLTNFTHTMGSDVDYVEIPVQGSPQQRGNAVRQETVRLPTLSQLSVTVQPVYSRSRMRNFDLGGFSQGNLLDKGFI